MSNQNIKIEGTFTTEFDAVSPGREGAKYKRQSFKRIFSGDLDGISIGENLEAGDYGMEYGGYVSVETFTGALLGKFGTFDMMFWATLQCGLFESKGDIVGGSGTGELADVYGYPSMKRGLNPKETKYVLDLYPEDY